MKKSKIIIDPFVLAKIADSSELSDNEKVSFLSHIWYLTKSEREELVGII